MSKHDNKKLEAIGLLTAERTPKDVARELTVPYQTVLKWKKELEAQTEKDKITGLVQMDKEVVHKLADVVAEEFEEIEEGTGEIVKSVVGSLDTLSTLETNLQNAGLELTKRIHEQASTADNAVELEALVSALAKLHSSFFGKGANVNVLNMPGGNVSDNSMSMFKTLQRDA